MGTVRKNYRLDADLVKRAREILETSTETQTIVEALRRVVEGEELARRLSEGRASYPDWADPLHEQ